MIPPLQIPGGPELIVVFVILFLFLIPLAVAAGVIALLYGRKNRVEELESRVDELEAALDERE